MTIKIASNHFVFISVFLFLIDLPYFVSVNVCILFIILNDSAILNMKHQPTYQIYLHERISIILFTWSTKSIHLSVILNVEYKLTKRLLTSSMFFHQCSTKEFVVSIKEVVSKHV